MSVGSIGANAIVFFYQIIVLLPVAITADIKYLNFTRCFEVEWSHLSCMMWNMDTLGKVKSIVGIL